MIGRLNLRDNEQVRQLFAMQRAAYAREAELIGSFEIPALTESLADPQNCGEQFYGYWLGEQLAGAISYKREADVLDIYRLVVHPAYFRRGIGRALVQWVEHIELDIERIVVSTGAKNTPAKNLYTQLGFIEKEEKEVIPGLFITLFEKFI